MSKEAELEVTDPRLPKIVERLREGASLLSESKALGYTHNGVLRAALRKHLGGLVQYDAMMSGRQGRRKTGPALSARKGSES